jgi:hypothetical protein
MTGSRTRRLRSSGRSPRQLGTNPRALGTNPRAVRSVDGAGRPDDRRPQALRAEDGCRPPADTAAAPPAPELAHDAAGSLERPAGSGAQPRDTQLPPRDSGSSHTAAYNDLGRSLGSAAVDGGTSTGQGASPRPV